MTNASAVPYMSITPAQPFTRFPDDEIEQSIPERFEQQVETHGERLAIRSELVSFTYRSLDQAANRVARRLLSRRGDEREAVALVFEHGASVLAAMLGVLKAGKFYVVLDPSYPRDRLTYMLGDSGARLIVADPRNLTLARDLSRGAGDLVVFDDFGESVVEASVGRYPSPDALAMILYTSGSTGRPKGVMHSHRNVLADVRNLTNEWGISALDRWLLHTSVSFANSVRTIFGSLLNGASVYPYDTKSKGLGGLAEWLLANEITILRSVPTTFRNFMSTLPENRTFPAVRILSVGGEPMLRSDLDHFNRHFLPHCVLVHPLGPTECLTVCWSCIPHGMRIAGNKLPVGYSLTDKDVLLLDEGGRELPEGEVGEIAVRSRYISPGYWRDPIRTKAAFQPDPSGSDMRIYLTGDLGVRLPGGCLVHLGRRDFLVKIRGFRIDVAEIEAALHNLEDIEDAVVVGREGPSGENRLVAYFVPRTRPGITVTKIRQGLARVLPDYMIPSAFVPMDAIPQTPNGKADRLRLPPPPRDRPQLDAPFAPAETATELELTRIWSEVLDLDRIGIHDSFFDLGGDSLLAARVSARVIESFGLELPMTALFEAPTPAGLANVIISHQLKELGDVGTAARLAAREAPPPEGARRLDRSEPA
jgi:amino acid adenylation domain-containing protein